MRLETAIAILFVVGQFTGVYLDFSHVKHHASRQMKKNKLPLHERTTEFYRIPVTGEDELSTPVENSDVRDNVMFPRLYKRELNQKNPRKRVSSDYRRLKRVRKSHLSTKQFLKDTHTRIKKTLRQDGRRRTEILTPKFHVSIIDRYPYRGFLKKKLKDANASRRSNFIFANDNDNDVAEEFEEGSDANSEIKPNMLEAVKHFSSIPQRVLKETESEHLLDENMPSTRGLPVLQTIYKKQQKKKRLTKLFVRFMKDMTQKLKIDPLTVADLLVSDKKVKRSAGQ
ncbi:uncharacterized protein LOC130662689 isoform X2 [Hydractinia symbiolongicarpus]|uniref:uncharacterized protein LOC130662689 isoform X2 n=1 Tax=Hydractinia symbiolongicarpus TaxID=13093 RepID=UPI0025511891|nr:uncharacterized protein LOC130662689 isoform X2 [Hydractinia symbiolongicarpus]